MDIELRQLRAFVAVADAGSFTRAASELYLSQAAVSRAVASLEATLGTRLLRRTTREVGLTAAGTRLLGPARRILGEVSGVGDLVRASGASLRVGHAWGALGRHTLAVQRRWADEFQGSELVLVHLDTPSSGLLERQVDVAILRRPVSDRRLASAMVGTEPRFAAVAEGDPLARRRSVSLNDFAGRTVAIDDRTGTTTLDLWPSDRAPATTRASHGMDDWLHLVAAGQAIGITAEATTYLHPRAGLRFRPVRDAEPVVVSVAWRRADPPDRLDTLLQLVREAYARG
jgi:DNA-binding transcriptional LysR family regulator